MASSNRLLRTPDMARWTGFGGRTWPVARIRPISALIDGRPDAPGRAVARRAMLLTIPVVLAANVAGAVVVFTLDVWVLPVPHLGSRHDVLIANVVAATAYVVLAAIVGTLWGLGRWRKTREWLVRDRPPTDEERRETLRVPLRQLEVSLVLWGIAVVGEVALNATWSWTLAAIVGTTTLLGGTTTGAMTYLLTERVMRAASARALAGGMPEKPVLPGVLPRALLAWGLGSGVPLIGLCTVAVVDLAGGTIGEGDLATTALVLGGVAIVAGVLITGQAARAVADPVRSVRDALARVEAGQHDVQVSVFDGSDLGLLQAGFNRMNAGLREREELRDLFGR